MRKSSGGYEMVVLNGATGLLPRHWPEEYQASALKAVLQDAVLSQVI